MTDQSYNRYIQHSLNSSPSKMAYSFSKGSRFLGDQKHKFMTNQISPHKNYVQSARGARYTLNEVQKKKKREDYQIFGVRRQVGRILKEMEGIRLAPKLEPPGFKYTYISRYQYQRELQEEKKAKKNISPYKREQSPTIRHINQSPENYNSSTKNTLSPKSHHSPAKINQRMATEANRYDQDPTARATCYGYYPIGLQTQSSGKYFNSRIKNVNGVWFGPPPPKPSQAMARNHEKMPKALFYNTFSQFGPSRNR